MIKKINVAIIGQGEESIAAYRVIREVAQVKLVGVVDYDGRLTELIKKEKDKVLIIKDFRPLIQDSSLNVILFAGEDLELLAKIKRLKNPASSIMEARAGNFLTTLLQTNKELLEAKKLKGELWAILNSVQEAIEVADNTGLIKYVNPSFTRVTGIPADKRVGKNIFEVSPQGALAQSLICQQKVVAYRSNVGGSGVEVISNAAPIVVEGEIEGAVVVFQAITDIFKLMDELQKSSTIIENLYTRMDVIMGSKYTFKDLVGKSKIFRTTVEAAQKISRGDFTIFLTGENGTGKNVFAPAIHQYSQRRNKPFVKIKCTDIPEEIMESEFFGSERETPAGTITTKLGRVEIAYEGTLFIEEIGVLKLFLQQKLLKFLKTKKFRRIGGKKDIKGEVRVIISSSIDLKQLVREGKFLEELYFLLNLQKIVLPPLRERREDIPELVQHFIFKYNRKLGKKVKVTSEEARQILVNYEWPGNIRELDNIIERAMMAVEGSTLKKEHLSPYISRFNYMETGQYMEILPLSKMEQMMLKAALSRYGESLAGKKKIAAALNISLATLYNKLKKYKIKI